VNPQTFEWIKFAVDIGQFVLMGGIGFYVYISNKNDTTNSSINRLREESDKRLDNHADRISKLEGLVENMPTHDDLGELHTRINKVSEQSASLIEKTDGQTEILRAMRETVRDIQKFLLDQSNNKK
jgi:hypothetical protein